MRRVAVHTLGCKLNFAETSTIARQFRQRGYEIVGIDERANVCVINTCSVTERADRECRQIVRRALRQSPNAYIVVVGCYAQLRPAEIAAIPGVDLVLGTREKFEVFAHANDFSKTNTTRTVVSPLKDLDTFSPASSVGFADRTRAFLKVQDGCDYSCAFCTIPLARGASRSTPVLDLVEQAKLVVGQGYREIVLTGVNVGDYGRKIGTSLLELMKELVGVDGLDRIRVSSVEPNLLPDELLSFWMGNPKVCKHFHMALQGGNDEILRGMQRRYLTNLYADRVAQIKTLCPKAAIGADIIVGFPGETDQLFAATYRFLVDLPISYLHVFTYSDRPNTASITMNGKVEPRIRFERSEALRILSARKRRLFYESFLDATFDVLFEDKSSDGYWTGLSGEYVRVKVRQASDLANRICRVTVTNVEDEACIGKLIDTPFLQSPIYSLNSKEVSLCD